MTAMYPSQVRFDALPRDVMVEVAGVSRTFGSKAAPVHALADVSVRIGRGQLAALVGRSGSGKTTLLNCIGGLDKPDGGTVVIDGATVTKLSEQGRATLRRDQVAFIFQTFGLVPMLSAAENIGLPMRLRKVSSAEREKRVALLLELVGLSPHALQRPGELSGGQQQRGDRQPSDGPARVPGPLRGHDRHHLDPRSQPGRPCGPHHSTGRRSSQRGR